MLREKLKRNISVLYSVRTEDQICFPALLKEFQTQIVVTAHSPRIDRTLLRPMLDKKPLVYVCGSKQFVDAITAYLLECGLAQDDIRRELFTLQ
jgi:ferredoxin-NADP reductase